jgi:citrate synthase
LTFYPDATKIFDKQSRLRQTHRLIAKVPSIAAYAYRHIVGRPYIYPDNDLSFTGNLLNMLFRMPAEKFQPNPVLARALDVLFILHADHEQNCSTSAMRNIGSSHVDPYSALAGAAAALYGPLHGGANEAVLRMLNEIGSVSKVPEFIKKVKSGEANTRLMGFGHRVYKSYDPRAKVIKRIADLGLDLPGDGFSGRVLPGALRDPAHRGLDRPVGGDAARSRAEDRPAEADLHGRQNARLRHTRQAWMKPRQLGHWVIG